MGICICKTDKETEPKMFDKPWRDLGIRRWDKKALDELLHHARNFRPRGGYDYTNILLLGTIGTGKSSFFNTIDSSLGTSKDTRKRAVAGSHTHSYTTSFHVYKMESKEAVKFRICDCRGIATTQSIQNEDIIAIIDGHMKSGYTVNPKSVITETDPKYRRGPTVQDKMHCIVWCFEATTAFEKLDEDEQRQIKMIQGAVRSREIGQLVLLSKTDHFAKILGTKIHKTFYSTEVKRSVESFSHSLGLPVSCVLPMKNYCDEVVKNIEVDILALFNLKQILGVANDSLMNLMDHND